MQIQIVIAKAASKYMEWYFVNEIEKGHGKDRCHECRQLVSAESLERAAEDPLLTVLDLY